MESNCQGVNYIFQLVKKMQKENNSSLDIGKYTLLTNCSLGRGATGTVYKGVESSTQTPVAVKHIDLATINDDATRTLLQN